MMKKTTAIILIAIFFLAALFTGCGKTLEKPFEHQGFYMGTVVSEKIYGKNAGNASQEVMAKIGELEKVMTINAAGGEINELNSQSGKASVKLDKDVFFVLQKAKKYGELSEGTFDVTIGPLVKAWGVFTDNPKVPSQNEIDSLKKLTDYRDIVLDADTSTAMLKRSNQIVDLGGIAKGYAGDVAIDIYKKNGIKSAFVNLGGNVVVLGGKPDGNPWKIGVQNPRGDAGRYVGILSVKDKAVVSSGDYERYFEKDGVRYHHILDPRTGYPADSGLIATTIVSDSSIDADALSTSIFVLGLEKGMKLVESLNGVDAVFITKDKKVYTTSGLKNIFKFEDETGEFQYVEKR